MAKNGFKSVDEYFASLPDASRRVLEKVRGVVRKAVPNAQELISYQIPALRFDVGMVLFYSAWTEHYSFYPATPALVAAFKEELAPYVVGKGTIRFPLSAPVPMKLIGRLAKFRAEEALALAAAKAAVKKRKAAAKRPAPQKPKAPKKATARRR